MVGEINFFDSMDYLEPKCPKCKAKVEYGITTKFDEKKQCHLCLKCGAVIK